MGKGKPWKWASSEEHHSTSSHALQAPESFRKSAGPCTNTFHNRRLRLKDVFLEPKPLSIPSQHILNKVRASASQFQWNRLVHVLTLEYQNKELEDAFRNSLYPFLPPHLLVIAAVFLAFSIVGIVTTITADISQLIGFVTLAIALLVLSISWISVALSNLSYDTSEIAFFSGGLMVLIIWIAAILLRHFLVQYNFRGMNSVLNGLISFLFVLPVPFLPLRWALAIWIFGLSALSVTLDVLWDIVTTSSANRIDYGLGLVSYFFGLLFIMALTYLAEKERRYYFYNMCTIKSRVYKHNRYYEVDEGADSVNDLDAGLDDEKVIQIVEAMVGVVRRGDNITTRSSTWRSDVHRQQETTEMGTIHSSGDFSESSFPSIGSAFFHESERNSVSSVHENGTPSIFKKKPAVTGSGKFDQISFGPPILPADSGCGKVWNWNVLSLAQDPEIGGNVLFEVGRHLASPLISGVATESRLAPILPTNEVSKVPCLEDNLLRFLRKMQDSYEDNPYHNQLHASEVAHLGICITTMEGIRSANHTGFCFPQSVHLVDISGPTAEFAFIIASLAHDVGHPGLTNSFLISIGSQLALTYNDISVLENFHAAVLFEIASVPERNIFERLPQRQYWDMRKRIIELILATDMSRHFSEIGEFRLRVISPDFNWVTRADDGWMFARFCLKAADLGHGTLDWEQHQQWSTKVMEEFYKQGDEESRLGFKKSPLCERQNAEVYANSQHGFLQFVVAPLYEKLSDMCTTLVFDEVCIKQLNENAARWKEILESSRKSLSANPSQLLDSRCKS